MPMPLKGSSVLAVFILALGRSAPAQSRPPAVYVGCYVLTRGPWAPMLGGDSIFHILPERVRLDTMPTERGGWRLSPNISYPYPHEFPGAPGWRLSGDSIRLLWSDGFNPTSLTLAASDSALVGEAVARSDLARPGGPPRARVVLRRHRCDDARLRRPAF